MKKIKKQYKKYKNNEDIKDLTVDLVENQKTNTFKQNKDLFRISGKRLLLTFSQIDDSITAQDLLQLLQQKLHLVQSKFQYVIAREMHTDGNTHYHVISIHNKRFEIKNKQMVDVEFKGNIFHGNYQPVKYLEYAVQYVCKDKEYISNIPNLQDGKILDDKEFVLQRTKEVGYKQALVEYYDTFPKKALTTINTFKNNLKQIQALQDSLQDDIIETPFTIENFEVKGILKLWVEKLFKEKALILVGESGIGKTQFGKALCKHNKWKTLLVNEKQDFKRIDTSYDAIIIDDANFNDFDYFQKLALLDNTVDNSIRVLYQTVRKKQGVVTMLLMNHKPFAEVSKLFDYKPFGRRIAMYQPEQPFMINVYNYQINNNNNTYNFHNHNHNTKKQGLIDSQKQDFQQHLEEEEQLMKDNRNTLAKIRQHPDFLAESKQIITE